jgi:hypothetical protein
MKQTESITAKADISTSNTASASYKYNLIQQKVRVGNKADSFSINVTAMLPAIQDIDSTRDAKCKPIEYTQAYLDWLIAEMVQANGIKEACTRVFNKCVMIQLNQAVSVLLKAEYEKALIENPDKLISKFDLEKLINNSELIKFYNDKHTFPESERADSMLSSTKRKVDKANKMRVENGNLAWNDTEVASKISALYAIELAKQAEQNDLLS